MTKEYKSTYLAALKKRMRRAKPSTNGHGPKPKIRHGGTEPLQRYPMASQNAHAAEDCHGHPSVVAADRLDAVKPPRGWIRDDRRGGFLRLSDMLRLTVTLDAILTVRVEPACGGRMFELRSQRAWELLAAVGIRLPTNIILPDPKLFLSGGVSLVGDDEDDD
jgi:hypothetical protein